MRRVRTRSFAAVAAAAVLLAGCSPSLGDGDGPGGDGADSTEAGGDAVAVPRPEEAPPAEDPQPESTEQDPPSPPEPMRAEGCPAPEPMSDPDGPQAQARVLDRGGDGRPRVEAVVYPRPDHEGSPWSHWGQGLVLDDGRYWSAIGDHLGPDGNSYFFAYDHESSTLTRFGDVLSNVEHQPGAWGFGKVHGQLVQGPCGEVWASTYWGTRRGLTFSDGYEGDVILRLDLASHEIEPVVTPVPRRGIPSLAGAPQVGLLYGEAVDPDTDEGRFFVVDMGSGEVILDDEVEGHTGFRNILVAADGSAYIAVGDHRLAAFRPGSESLEPADLRLPGEWLRASTEPAADGTVYGATRNPDRFFSVTPDGSVQDLGDARGYTASMALSPDGDGFLYVPGAHGNSWEQGTPLLWVDGATGEHRTVVELHDLGVEAFDLRLGGTYSIAVDADERVAYITMNAGEAGEASFGEVVLVIVELP